MTTAKQKMQTWAQDLADGAGAARRTVPAGRPDGHLCPALCPSRQRAAAAARGDHAKGQGTGDQAGPSRTTGHEQASS